MNTCDHKTRAMWVLSPWLLVWLSGILGLAVLALTFRETEREKNKMIGELVTRANALIWALEAGTRTWLGYEGERNVLQMLLEETAKQPGIVYLAVVDADGFVLAHSDRTQVGQAVDTDALRSLAKPDEVGWRETGAGGTAVFEVYTRFAPVSGEAARMHGRGGHHGLPGRLPSPMRGRGMRRGGPRGEEGAVAETYVLAGLDQRPFQEAMREDLYNSILTAAIVASLGLAGIVSVFWARNYRRSNQLLLEAQAQVRRNEKLTALGTLAAGVAHEVRNPLSTIKGLATVMAGKMPDDERGQNAAKNMILEINRLNNVVSELLEFARPSASAQATAQVNDVVARALRLADAEIRGNGITVHFTPCPRLPAARISAERLTQALLNLFINAAQAMPGGGNLTIRADTLNAGDEWVRLVVQDDGVGMTDDVREAAFNPYFTTKPSGTGLGLAIVHQIITANGGDIAVASGPGAGCLFTVRLPAADADTERES